MTSTRASGHPGLRWAAISAGVLALLSLMIVARTPLVALDVWIVRMVAIPLDHPAWPAVRWVTDWGGGAGIAAVLVVLTLMILREGRPRLLLPLWAGFAGTRLVTDGLKHLIDRPRPEMGELVHLLANAASPAFPSGHAASAIFLYGFVAYLVGRSDRSAIVRRAAVLLLTGVILAVGASRMVLGVHYPSDVLAGFLSGGIMLAVAAVASDRWVGSRYTNAR